MKDKTITKNHYDYTNNVVIILGFKNLADFSTNISYTILKKNQEYICLKINETLDVFKKLFPQEKFDLRKINYTFKNINQVIGFVKKLFNHMCIPLDYYRFKEIPTMRLIQPNNLYNNYILNMSEIPQNTIILEEVKQIPFIDINTIIEKFEKKDVNKKMVVENNFIIDGIDWIDSIKITSQDYKEIPVNTQLSLIINNEELIINNDITLNSCVEIELLNKFLYSNSIHFKISNKYTNLENEKYLIEVDGFDVLNKNECLSSNKKIIKFNHKKFYSSLNLGIYDDTISIGINEFYKTRENDKTFNADDIQNSLCSMKYVLSYLKKSFEKEYNILNKIDFGLVLFDYFNYVKIRNEDKNKLLIGTVISFYVGGNVVFDYIINENTEFDEDNYYRFDIDFPNQILYKYHFSKLLIKEKNKNFYNIVINGSQFKNSIPKKILNSNILFNHDPKWFVENEKSFSSVSGMVGNNIKKNNISNNNNITEWRNSSIEPNKEINNKISHHIHFFENHEKNNKIINAMIEVEKNIYQKLVFINNEPNTNDIYETNPIFYVYDLDFLEHLKVNKYLDRDSQTFSVGLNSYLFTNKYPDICEIVLNKKCRLFYILKNIGDMISNIEINFNDEITETYNINAWIEFDNKIIYDFGINQINKKIILNFGNEIINLIGVNTTKKFLVIEIPQTEISNWKNINISGNLINTSCIKFRKELLLENNNKFNIVL
jgi:hypothetical protein